MTLNIIQRCKPIVQSLADNIGCRVKNSTSKQVCLVDALLTPNPSKSFHGLAVNDVINEALLFTIGGSHTTAYTMACGIYYLIQLPRFSKTLREELEGASSLIENMDYDQLKRLPYLVSI